MHVLFPLAVLILAALTAAVGTALSKLASIANDLKRIAATLDIVAMGGVLDVRVR